MGVGMVGVARKSFRGRSVRRNRSGRGFGFDDLNIEQ